MVVPFMQILQKSLQNRRYKLSFIATDGTAEAEMIYLDQIAQRIVGKNVEAVIRSARRANDTPPDLAAIISLKFTFNLTITEQSYYKPEKSYQVNSIVASFGRQDAIPRVPRISELGQSSQSSQSLTPSNTLLLDQVTLETPAPTLHITEDMGTPEETGVRKNLFPHKEQNDLAKDDNLKTEVDIKNDTTLHAGSKRNSSPPKATNIGKTASSESPRIQKSS